MPSTMRAISTALWLSGALLLTACAHRPPPSRLHIDLPASLTTATARPERPRFARLPAPEATGAAERSYLTEAVIKPLLAFSVRQEAAVAKEQDRADALSALIKRVNGVVAKP